ncbi:50S ribosomal protein L23 [Candidatus Woesearchaeota archaeon]|nr:50S ribosomal protein L23 [Candidatus Woesearchaeota archaeon]
MTSDIPLSSVIKYPLSTEKTIRLMESENTLIFVVDLQASKPLIKKAVEESFKVRVANVHTSITSKGLKKAYVAFAKDSPAIDIATKMGLM